MPRSVRGFFNERGRMILCQGDLHLSQYIWTKYRDIEGDSQYGLTQFVDHGLRLFKEGKVSHLFFLGDLFDSISPSTGIVQVVRSEIDRCKEAGLPVLFIDGNHDKRPVPWLSAIHSWAKYVGDGQPFEIQGQTLAALDFTDIDSVEQWVRSLPEEVSTIFLHQQCRQYMDIPGIWDFDLDWVPQTVRRVIMGHVHDAWKFEYRAGCCAYYTGSTHMRAIDQSYDKSSLLLKADLSVERLPLKERPTRRFDIEFLPQLDDVREWVEQKLESELPPVAMVYYHLAEQEDVLPVLHELDQSFAGRVIPRLAHEKRKGEKADQSAAPTLTSLSELASQVADPEEQPHVFRLAMDVMGGSTPIEQLVEQRYQVFKEEVASAGN